MIPAYQKAIELNPESYWLYDQFGWVYLLQDNLDEASRSFEQAIRLAPEHYNPVFTRGSVYALQGNLDGAKQRWQEGVNLCPIATNWKKLLRAVYVIAAGDHQQGLTELQAAIAANERRWDLEDALDHAEILARCPIKLEGIDQAVAMLKAAMEVTKRGV
jgi:tetratricopeptide (TPR) repeat protein